MLIPMGFNTIRILSPMSPNMQHSYVFVYLLLTCLVDNVMGMKWKPEIIIRYVFTGTGLAVLLLCAQIANTAYTSTATAHRATQTYASNLVGRVESTEGYKKDMEVVIIGSFPEDIYYNTVEGFDLVEHYSCLSSNVVPLNKHIYYYLNDWLNVPWEQPAEDIMM